VDTISAERRSENMRRIRSKGMKPEMVVRQLAHRLGYRYRLHSPKLPGKPDLVFPRLKKVIEVRGCFWHQHGGCIDSHVPKSRMDYWRPKLMRNQQRDVENIQRLEGLGFRVLVLWECEITNDKRLAKKLQRFLG
jgi:DNA mismatch endonuclease (patch repair protein)